MKKKTLFSKQEKSTAGGKIEILHWIIWNGYVTSISRGHFLEKKKFLSFLENSEKTQKVILKTSEKRGNNENLSIITSFSGAPKGRGAKEIIVPSLPRKTESFLHLHQIFNTQIVTNPLLS